EAAFARVLNDGRLATGQVTEGTVANPGVCEGHAGWLRAAELAPRSLDVGAVLLRRRAHLPGLADLPSERLQTSSPVFVALGQADGQLEPHGRPGRERLVFQERDTLLLADGLSLEFEFAFPPVGDRCVGRSRVHWGGRPLRQEYGRRCVVPAEAAVGESARRSPDGLADREVGVMRRDLDVAPGHPDLQ